MRCKIDMTYSILLTAILALALGMINIALWRDAMARARRRRERRAAMRRARLLCHYPGELDDPYLDVWERALARIEEQHE